MLALDDIAHQLGLQAPDLDYAHIEIDALLNMTPEERRKTGAFLSVPVKHTDPNRYRLQLFYDLPLGQCRCVHTGASQVQHTSCNTHC